MARTGATSAKTAARVKTALVAGVLLLGACVQQDLERMKAVDLSGAMEVVRGNIAAIHRRDPEAYLSYYIDSPDLVVVTADGLRSGFLLFAEARRASKDWPDTLITEQPRLVWLAPGVVWGAFAYTVVQRGDTGRGVSERILVKSGKGWKIAVTGTMER